MRRGWIYWSWWLSTYSFTLCDIILSANLFFILIYLFNYYCGHFSRPRCYVRFYVVRIHFIISLILILEIRQFWYTLSIFNQLLNYFTWMREEILVQTIPLFIKNLWRRFLRLMIHNFVYVSICALFILKLTPLLLV